MTTTISGNIPTIIRSIKGTNLNKGRARTWIEIPEIETAPYNFRGNDRVDIQFLGDGILITQNDTGARKITRKVKNNRVFIILDICYPDADRTAMFGGAARLTVRIKRNSIMVTI